MSNLGRPSVWAEHRDEMVRLYESGMSRGQVARHFDTSVQSVTRQLRAANVMLEKRKGDNPNAGRTPEQQSEINARVSASRKGKATGPRVARDEIECAECQTKFFYVPGKTGREFCSRKCRGAAIGRERTQQAQQEYAENATVCKCGASIPYEYRHTRQFCSDSCRRDNQIKRQPDPANYVTFDCQTCGTPTTRYKNYGNGALKFCSNLCAYKHTKTVKHYVVRDMDMVLDNGWEAFFAGVCRVDKIPVIRHDRSVGVAWSECEGGWYAPDFDLPTFGVTVEVKGQEDEDDPAKWEAYRAAHGALVVLGPSHIAALRRGVSLGEVLRINP